VSAAEVAKPEMRVFLGLPRQVQNVRDFVTEVLDACPVADDVVLLASELAANAIVHTVSGKGGTFMVTVIPMGGLVRVEVHDEGSDAAPGAHVSQGPAESGRGLYLVEALATRWGHLGNRDGRMVWFEVEW
jgi:anti-sigma regulatory factor (Ser/Thr protein kinase)